MYRLHRRLFGSAFAVATALIVGVLLVYPKPTAITEQNVAKIRREMCYKEVKLLLGGPPRDESGGTAAIFWAPVGHWPIVAGPHRQEQWISNQYAVTIDFYDDRVLSFYTGSPIVSDETLVERIRRWLRL